MTFESLEAVYRSYRHDPEQAHDFFKACLDFARQLVSPNNPDREDIVHHSAWKAWSYGRTLDEKIPFGPWYTRVVKNAANDYARACRTRQRKESSDIIIPERAFTPDEQEQMRELAGTERVLVDLLLLGHKLDEIADALNTTVRSIKRRLSSIRKENENV